jgi:hypothetical protein
MNTGTFRFSRFTAAACALVITAVGAWAFVNSTDSQDRDVFHFAAVMAANAQIRATPLQARNLAAPCPKESSSSRRPTSSPAQVCLGG